MSGIILASIAVQNVTYHIDKLYDYKVPTENVQTLRVGCRVLVPFGKTSNERSGIVINIHSEEVPPKGLKQISVVIDKEPLFDDKMIRLAEFMKERTFCTLYDALKIMIPGSKNSSATTMIRMVKSEICAAEYESIKEKLPSKQALVLEKLLELEQCSVKELCYYTGVTAAVVNALSKKGIVSFFDKEVYKRPYEGKITDTADILLTDEQQTAYDNLIKQFESGGGTSLLYGVTGSGKTQVYLKLIDKVIETGRGVIVMVPEISLTPQTLNLFHARYGERIAVFHSSLSNGERLSEWKRVKDGKAQIAVGTRSAIFAPFKELGLIIMDEEQEHTYKSEQSPRYHARNIAKYRCYEDKALLLLASATPSFESYTLAKQGKYTLNTLINRYGKAVLPEVEVVDMVRERKSGNRAEISRSLLASLMQNLDEGRQSILLFNRRGYNTYVSCGSCGSVLMCPHCSISLTYHRANDRLMCHYCGYSAQFETVCSDCGAMDMRYVGAGTQRFEEELVSLLPNARILRMDADSTMQKFSFDEKLADFKAGKYDIMIGTQMVAKGLDFENVTLVGVISADSQLYNDDYQSMENTFDLVTQVVGRAGRGKYKGKAIIQTIAPENEVITLAAKQDFEAFYNTEIKMRQAMVYPPFCSMCEISFQGFKEEKVQASALNFLYSLKEYATKANPVVKLIALGPMPERVVKKSEKYHYRILIKCKNDTRFRALLSELLVEFNKDGKNSGISAIPDIS